MQTFLTRLTAWWQRTKVWLEQAALDSSQPYDDMDDDYDTKQWP